MKVIKTLYISILVLLTLITASLFIITSNWAFVIATVWLLAVINISAYFMFIKYEEKP